MEIIVLGDHIDYHMIPYQDFNKIQDCRYIANIDSDSILLNCAYRLLSSPRFPINRYFEKIWFPFIYRDSRKDQDKVFIFFSRRLDIVGEEYVLFLKKKYKSARFVCVYQDLIKTHKQKDVVHIKQLFDFVVTFDERDAIDYGIGYFPLIYSHMDYSEKQEAEYDVYFVGFAKDRYPKIIYVYQQLKNMGLRLDFSIVGVDENAQRVPGMNYISHSTYEENIAHIRKSTCILEILQNNGSSSTLRLSEAIAYRKKLISNAVEMENNELFDNRYIYMLDRDCNIGTDFIDWLHNKDNPDFASLQQKISPETFVKYILESIEHED